MKKKNGIKEILIPIFFFTLWVLNSWITLPSHGTGASGWAGRLVGLFRFIVATLTGFMKASFLEEVFPSALAL